MATKTKNKAKARQQTRFVRIKEEAVFLAGNGTVDRANKIIRNVKICGYESINRRKYKEEAFDRVEEDGILEGVRVFVGHCDDPGDREIDDEFGRVVNVKHRRGKGLYGDLKYYNSHRLCEHILEMFEDTYQAKTSDKFKGSPGLSPIWYTNARDTALHGEVSEIRKAESVDVVTFPATTNSIREHVEDHAMTTQVVDEKEIRRAERRKIKMRAKQAEREERIAEKAAAKAAKRIKEEVGPDDDDDDGAKPEKKASAKKGEGKGNGAVGGKGKAATAHPKTWKKYAEAMGEEALRKPFLRIVEEMGMGDIAPPMLGAADADHTEDLMAAIKKLLTKGDSGSLRMAKKIFAMLVKAGVTDDGMGDGGEGDEVKVEEEGDSKGDSEGEGDGDMDYESDSEDGDKGKKKEDAAEALRLERQQNKVLKEAMQAGCQLDDEDVAALVAVENDAVRAKMLRMYAKDQRRLRAESPNEGRNGKSLGRPAYRSAEEVQKGVEEESLSRIKESADEDYVASGY